MADNRLIDRLRNFFRPSRVELAADLLVPAVAALALLLAVAGYYALPTLPIYGHDAVHYYVDFRFKLVEDGRWLNFMLHEFLRSVPLSLWSLLFLSLFWLFFYKVARACGIDVWLAALVASTTLVSAPFPEMSLWPASVAPALMVACLAFFMQARGIAYQVIYITCGVLIFGSMQTIYFLLPLVFLPQFLDTSQPARARWLLLLKHMLWWVAGSVVGVLVMMVMLWQLADIFFPHPAAWRNTHPVVDFSSLLSNIGYVISSFATQLQALLRLGGVTWAFGIICIIAAVLRARTLKAQTPALALMCAVLVSFFVFSVPMAPIIQMRSLIAMAAAVILFLAMLPGRTPLGRIVAALLLVRLTQHYADLGQEQLERQRAETTVYMEALQDLFRGYSWTYSALALDGMMDPAQPEARRFNDGSLMHPLMVSLGVRSFFDCRIPGRCDGVDMMARPISMLPFADGRLELSVNAQNVGIVRYRKGK